MALSQTDLKDGKSLVLLSGGQDSAISLAWALQTFAQVETLSFDYGQRHLVELDAAKTLRVKIADAFPDWSAKLKNHHHLTLDCLNVISETALTRERVIELADNGLPTSFVPGRNLLFLTYAAALGFRRGMTHLVGGMCETDYSGYPDCRAQTLNALESALNLGMETSFTIHTPLMHLDKAQSWELAHQLGGTPLVEIIRLHSHTCYLGNRDILHTWGYGCGECPACRLRAKGYTRYEEMREKAHATGA